MTFTARLAIAHLFVLALPSLCLSADALPRVTDDEWGLKIVIFSVGQADAALVLARNGDAAIIATRVAEKTRDR